MPLRGLAEPSALGSTAPALRHEPRASSRPCPSPPRSASPSRRTVRGSSRSTRARTRGRSKTISCVLSGGRTTRWRSDPSRAVTMSPAGPAVTTRRTREAGASACSTTSALLAAAQPEALRAERLLLAEGPVVEEPQEVRRRCPGRPPGGVAVGRVVGPPLAPDVGEHRQVAEHGDLGRQQAEGGPRRVVSRPQRVVDGRRRGSARGAAPPSHGRDRGPGAPSPRQQQQAQRHEVEEVAVADRAAAPVPVVGDQQDVAEPRHDEGGEGQPAVPLPRAHEQEEAPAPPRPREVRQGAAETADPESSRG